MKKAPGVQVVAEVLALPCCQYLFPTPDENPFTLARSGVGI
jgi:hypothetical protein